MRSPHPTLTPWRACCLFGRCQSRCLHHEPACDSFVTQNDEVHHLVVTNSLSQPLPCDVQVVLAASGWTLVVRVAGSSIESLQLPRQPSQHTTHWSLQMTARRGTHARGCSRHGMRASLLRGMHSRYSAAAMVAVQAVVALHHQQMGQVRVTTLLEEDLFWCVRKRCPTCLTYDTHPSHS